MNGKKLPLALFAGVSQTVLVVVFFIRNPLHPLHCTFMLVGTNGDVTHLTIWRSAMPVYNIRLTPDHISRLEYSDQFSPLLIGELAFSAA